MSPTILHKLSVVCIISATVPTASALAAAVDAAQAVGLLRRADADVCGGDASISQCGGNFPSAFCCPAETKCTALNDDDGAGGEATSVICCPVGQDCEHIRPITCDITQQNATLHPSNAIHTTNLTATLTTCGSECCPLGYTCENGLCAMIANSTSSGSAASSSASAAPTATSISTPVGGDSSSTSDPAAASSGASDLGKNHSGGGPSSGAIAGGVVGGIALGILLTILGIWLLKRRRDAANNPRYSGDFGPVSRTVSDPIYNPAFGARTEFLRRDAASPSGYGASLDRTLLASPFSPMREMNKDAGLNRNNTVTTTATGESNPYGYSRANNPPKPYGGLTAGPGGGMAATSPESRPPRLLSLFSRSPGPNNSNNSNPPMSSASPSVYTPTPAPRGQRPRSSTHRQPLLPTRTFGASGPRRSQSLSRGTRRPRTGSTETIDVLMPPGSFLQPPPRITEPGTRRLGAGGDGERPLTGDTTFTRLMENAGFGRESREGIRGWSNGGPSRDGGRPI